jgi:predicted RND superfamily exporter protein
MNSLARSLVQARFIICLLVLVAACGLWWFSKPVRFDQSIEGFFPPDHPALTTYQRARQNFGSDDIIFVVYDDGDLWSPQGMSRLKSLAQILTQRVSAIERVESLHSMPVPWRVDAAAKTLASESGMAWLLGLPKMIGGLATIETEVNAAADRPSDMQELRRRVCASPLFRQVLVDASGRTTSLIVRLKGSSQSDPKQAVREIRQQVDEFARDQGLARIAVAGPQVLLADGFIYLENDNRTLGLAAMALMALTMLVVVRSVRWALLPLISGGTAWLVTQQLLNVLDLQLTLSAGPIVAQTIVLCMPAVSHLAMHFYHSAAELGDDIQAAQETLASMAAPIAWCTLTAAAGYLALLSSTVRPVFQFGTIMAGCSILAALLAYLVAPAAMRSRRKLGQPTDSDQVALQVSQITSWAIARPRRTIACFLLPTLLISSGIAFLEFESNYIRIFKSHSRVASDYRFVEDRMEGIGIVELVFPAPNELTNAWLQNLSKSTKDLASSDPDVVTHVLSLADVLGPSDPSNIPASGAEAERILEIKLRLLNTAVYEHFLKNFWDIRGKRMRVLVRIRESVAAENKQLAFDHLAEKLSSSLGGEQVELTGLSHLMTQVTRAITLTQFQTAAWSGCAILLMLCAAFRSPRLALFALLPALMAVGLVLGVMGWAGIRIDLSTALVTSVAIGLSVDDTFYCLLRWQRERRLNQSTFDALRMAYAGTGPGVVLSSSTVSLGFLALVFSEFVPTANFGWLIAIATLGGSLGNLLVLPACLAISHRETANRR